MSINAMLGSVLSFLSRFDVLTAQKTCRYWRIVGSASWLHREIDAAANYSRKCYVEWAINTNPDCSTVRTFGSFRRVSFSSKLVVTHKVSTEFPNKFPKRTDYAATPGHHPAIKSCCVLEDSPVSSVSACTLAC